MADLSLEDIATQLEEALGTETGTTITPGTISPVGTQLSGGRKKLSWPEVVQRIKDNIAVTSTESFPDIPSGIPATTFYRAGVTSGFLPSGMTTFRQQPFSSFSGRMAVAQGQASPEGTTAATEEAVQSAAAGQQRQIRGDIPSEELYTTADAIEEESRFGPGPSALSGPTLADLFGGFSGLSMAMLKGTPYQDYTHMVSTDKNGSYMGGGWLNARGHNQQLQDLWPSLSQEQKDMINRGQFKMYEDDEGVWRPTDGSRVKSKDGKFFMQTIDAAGNKVDMFHPTGGRIYQDLPGMYGSYQGKPPGYGELSTRLENLYVSDPNDPDVFTRGPERTHRQNLRSDTIFGGDWMTEDPDYTVDISTQDLAMEAAVDIGEAAAGAAMDAEGVEDGWANLQGGGEVAEPFFRRSYPPKDIIQEPYIPDDQGDGFELLPEDIPKDRNVDRYKRKSPLTNPYNRADPDDRPDHFGNYSVDRMEANEKYWEQGRKDIKKARSMFKAASKKERDFYKTLKKGSPLSAADEKKAQKLMDASELAYRIYEDTVEQSGPYSLIRHVKTLYDLPPVTSEEEKKLLAMIKRRADVPAEELISSLVTHWPSSNPEDIAPINRYAKTKELQEGGAVEGAPADMANLGMINAPAARPQQGGQKSVQDDIPREADEGDYILPYETVLTVGLKQLNRYAREAIDLAVKNGVSLEGTDLDPTDDVPIKVSNYEYHIPKSLVPFFGGGKKYLDKIREEGLILRKRLEEEKQPSAQQQQPQPPMQAAPAPQAPMMQKGGFVMNPNEQKLPTTEAILESDTTQAQESSYNQMQALERTRKQAQQPPMVDPSGKIVQQGFAAPQGYADAGPVDGAKQAQTPPIPGRKQPLQERPYVKMINEELALFGKLDPAKMMALIALGEARGEDRDGMQAVMHVIYNRTKDSRFPSSVRDVILQPYAFSSIPVFKKEEDYSGNEYTNFKKMFDTRIGDKKYKQAYQDAQEILSGKAIDNTGGSVYYINPDKLEKKPSHLEGLDEKVRVGNHVFYKNGGFVEKVVETAA